ncbi:2,3-diaminopropionate biosynthesis protein SbnA [Kitasatospora sp. NPDC004272]
MIVSGAHELLDSDVYVDLRDTLGTNLLVKCEGFNFAGSVKLKAANWMVDAALQDGLLHPDSVLVESSSGNLGVALAVIAAARRLAFVCVTDPKCNPATVRLIEALGATVVVVDGATPDGSYLDARKRRVRELCAADPNHVWLNQYENPANWMAHRDTTAPQIDKRFPDLDVLFVGVGTGGTLTGCARYFRDRRPRVRIVAVDSTGSVNLGGAPGPRHIPGIGASVPMPLVDARLVDAVVRVPEEEALRTCRLLASRGLVLGGSTGTVVSGARQWLAEHDPDQVLRAVCVSPDLGERYLDTIYDDAWATRHFGSADTWATG